MIRYFHLNTIGHGRPNVNDHPKWPVIAVCAISPLFLECFENHGESLSAINYARNQLQNCVLHTVLAVLERSAHRRCDAACSNVACESHSPSYSDERCY